MGNARLLQLECKNTERTECLDLITPKATRPTQLTMWNVFDNDASHSLSYRRPRAPTPSAATNHDESFDSPISTDSFSFSPPPPPPPHLSPPSFSTMPLISNPHYPDQYPYRHLNSLPPLSSPGSSSASTRSSAYTTSGSALTSADYSHVHVASAEEDQLPPVGITSESIAHMLASDPNVSASARSVLSRPAPDTSRWSGSYPADTRSRSSSLSNNFNGGHEYSAPRLEQKSSYDMGWQTVDERDEVGISEDETDDDHALADDLGELHEERTSAAVIAEEGRGLIVEADSVPIFQLNVQPGTTHLLIGSSPTPNALPSFLTSTLPQISSTLLALDISANYLSALPPVLAICGNLEELNVASNPLRVLPVFLADLLNLRVLIADSTGISTLPDALVELDRLHTISVRRNKMLSLPSWLCLLPALQTLCVDGNPFQGPWKALVEPLLAKVPMTPVYPPSTPMFPSASIRSSSADTETDLTDTDENSDQDSPGVHRNTTFLSPEEEDQTITPERPPIIERAVTSPMPIGSNQPQPRGLARTRTTPNRAYYDQSRTKVLLPVNDEQPNHNLAPQTGEASHHDNHEIRKMKSAGDLRRGKSGLATVTEPGESPLPNYSASSSNLLNMTSTHSGSANKFASLGPSSVTAVSSRSVSSNARPQLTQSLWSNKPEAESGTFSPSRPFPNNKQAASEASRSPPANDKSVVRPKSSRENKEKSTRWGFLKKMSMGKMKPDHPPSPPQNRPQIVRPHTSGGTSNTTTSIPDRFSKSPQIDLRFSTTGTLVDAITAIASPISSPQSSPHRHMQQPSANPPSPNLLAPPSPLQRTTKRRSFLPVDAPGSLSISIPSDPSPFMTEQNGTEHPEARQATPSPTIDSEQYLRREEERGREAYLRALRSVMAYLKDMNDLGLSQQPNPLSMYGAVADDHVTRPRRPTGVDGQREVSMALTTSSTNFSELSGQLRSSESIAGLRSGTSSQTMSIATTDSNSSMEERKFKDDKGKRAMVIREIVITERTYVKSLQELVDIYIKPASLPVNLISGVGSKDTVVPPSERKLVFGGIDSLFSFHKDSFLPALEVAAAPLLKSTSSNLDADGMLSLNVAKAVGNIFLKHAAFMRMYSGYINNFDSSVQRVKYWSSDRASPGNTTSGGTLSPSSSSAQLASLGLSMSAISSPGVTPDGGPTTTGIPNLSTSQRKRIKTYLKRCRLNPRHTQLNLEGYLLLPVQRIPRYRLLLEQLLTSTPPTYEYMDDPLDRALAEISSLASNMNEGKREAESRRKLVQWQARIRGKFPSPLVQPHRRLIMDGPLLLTRVVRKTVVTFEAINAQGDTSNVQVDCLAPELTPRPLIGILCNDLLVLCRDPSDGQDPTSSVDLWAVLRMQTLPQPASIVHGNALRLVDNKAILYFDAPSPSDALNWYRAINLHIPASKT